MANAQRSLSEKANTLTGARFFFGVYSVRRRLATGAAGILALALGYHVVFGKNGLFVYSQKRTDARSLEVELRTLSDENDRLRSHVDRLQSDPDAIEHAARSVLHYTRPGEVVVMMPGSNPKQQ